MSATSITIRAMRWLSFVCQIPVLGGANWNGLQMIIRGGTPGQMGFYGARGILNSDSLLVYWTVIRPAASTTIGRSAA